MTVFDWLVLGSLTLGAIWGYSKGFLSEISGLLAILTGFLAIKFFKKETVDYLNEMEQLSDYVFFVPIMAAVFLFVSGYFLVKVAMFILKKLIHQTPLKHFDKFGGLALGLTKWFICILIFIYLSVEFKLPKVYDFVSSSKSGVYLSDVARKLATIVL